MKVDNSGNVAKHTHRSFIRMLTRYTTQYVLLCRM